MLKNQFHQTKLSHVEFIKEQINLIKEKAISEERYLLLLTKRNLALGLLQNQSVEQQVVRAIDEELEATSIRVQSLSALAIILNHFEENQGSHKQVLSHLNMLANTVEHSDVEMNGYMVTIVKIEGKEDYKFLPAIDIQIPSYWSNAAQEIAFNQLLNVNHQTSLGGNQILTGKYIISTNYRTPQNRKFVLVPWPESQWFLSEEEKIFVADPGLADEVYRNSAYFVDVACYKFMMGEDSINHDDIYQVITIPEKLRSKISQHFHPITCKSGQEVFGSSAYFVKEQILKDLSQKQPFGIKPSI